MMEDPQPPKYCNKCGRIIPADGYELDAHGKIVLDEKKQPIYRKIAYLICEHCAIAAMPKRAPRPRRRRGEMVPEQGKFDVPNIRID